MRRAAPADSRKASASNAGRSARGRLRRAFAFAIGIERIISRDPRTTRKSDRFDAPSGAQRARTEGAKPSGGVLVCRFDWELGQVFSLEQPVEHAFPRLDRMALFPQLAVRSAPTSHSRTETPTLSDPRVYPTYCPRRTKASTGAAPRAARSGTSADCSKDDARHPAGSL